MLLCWPDLMSLHGQDAVVVSETSFFRIFLKPSGHDDFSPCFGHTTSYGRFTFSDLNSFENEQCET